MPENWSGRIELVSAIDGRVVNQRRRPLPPARGPPPRPAGSADLGAGRHRPEGAHPPVAHRDRRGRPHARLPGDRELAVDASDLPDRGLRPAGAGLRRPRGRAGARREADRALHLARPRDQRAAAQRRAQRDRTIRAFDAALADHTRAWEELWDVCDIRVPGDRRVQFLLRLHISHILQVCSRMTAAP